MSVKQVTAIRGATTVDFNDEQSIKSASIELMQKIIAENQIDGKKRTINYVICSTTVDVTAFYPVRAIRESGLTSAPLFSATEPQIDGALTLCVRLMVVVSDYKKGLTPAKHIYLKGAKSLRPDLTEER